MYSSKLKTSIKLAAIVASIFILAGCGADSEEDPAETTGETVLDTGCSESTESSGTGEATTPVDTGDTADTGSASTTEE